MSKRINVNPGQYKTAGRERQGEDIVRKPVKAGTRPAKRFAKKRSLNVGR